MQNMKTFQDEAYINLLDALVASSEEDRTVYIDELLDNIKIARNTQKRATTVFWGDGTVTCVKATESDEMNDYSAFTAAFAKRMIGSNAFIKKITEKTQEQKLKVKKS